IYGMENTLEVSVEMMINHAKAVMKAATKALIVVDLPYGSYEKSQEQALDTAKRVMQESGCDAVKLECTMQTAPIVAFLVANNIPVMGHVGLLPQRVASRNGYKYQGREQ